MTGSMGSRWWVPPPRPGETLSSLVGRAARLYCASPQELWRELSPADPDALGDMDHPSLHGLSRLGATLGVAPSALLRARLVDRPWRLAPPARAAVCPSCLAKGLAREVEVLYRADWARVLVPTCAVHREALRMPVPGMERRLNVPSLADLGASDRKILALIEGFGRTLESALYFGGRWPTSWRGSPHQARTWMLRACLPCDGNAQIVPISQVNPPGALAAWVHGTAGHALPAVHGSAWERFRAIANPALRRAAVWAAAWMVIPKLPIRLQPGWHDWEAITRQASVWEQRKADRIRARRTSVH